MKGTTFLVVPLDTAKIRRGSPTDFLKFKSRKKGKCAVVKLIFFAFACIIEESEVEYGTKNEKMGRFYCFGR